MDDRYTSRIEEIREFRDKRIKEIKAGDTPFPLVDGAKIILHIVPSNALDSSMKYDLDSLNIDKESFPPLHVEELQPLTPTMSSIHLLPFPFDPPRQYFIVYLKYHDSGLSDSCAKIYSNGIIEAVDAYFLNARKNEKILLKLIEDGLLQRLQKYLQLQKQLSIELPLFIMLSYLGVRGYCVHGYRSQIDKDNFVIPEIEINNFEHRLEEIMKEISNRFLSESGVHKK